jgi:hypothetical protein
MSRAVVDAVLIDAPPKQAYAKKYAYDGNGNLAYVGWAQSDGNPQTSQAKWSIQKFVFTGSPAAMTGQQWGIGVSGVAGAEDCIWDNRATTVTYQ